MGLLRRAVEALEKIASKPSLSKDDFYYGLAEHARLMHEKANNGGFVAMKDRAEFIRKKKSLGLPVSEPERWDLDTWEAIEKIAEHEKEVFAKAMKDSQKVDGGDAC